MPRYRNTEAAAGQGLFLTVNLQDQLIPGTFEYMLNEIIGTTIDVSIFDKNYKNAQVGAPAVPPSVLLKLIIYGYSKGCISSRKLSELNCNNMVAKALTCDMNIHWTKIAEFISGNLKEFNDVFVKVLMYCNELALIGGETFAIDGLRLPSNASIQMSGTKEGLEKRLKLYQKMSLKHIMRHKKKDEPGEKDEEIEKRFEKRQKHLSAQIAKISNFIEGMEKKKGQSGREIKSNVTDNESAMIHSSKGNIQGYIGIAVADAKNQIIISAQAIGSANETSCLPEMLDKTAENLKGAEVKPIEEGKKQTILGDPNYFSEDNLRACEERGLDAIIPDSQEKRRVCPDGQRRYEISDFHYEKETDTYECPQGKSLNYKRTTVKDGHESKVYVANVDDCRACPEFARCSWSKKAQSEQKDGKTLIITKSNSSDSFCRKMREKLNTEEYQEKYSRRIQIVEPVFANMSYCKGLNRFMLRGKEKVQGQWTLYCMVNNLWKCLNKYNERRKSA